MKNSGQNFWQLASIQTASIGVAGVAISRYLVTVYGAGAIIPSAGLSNLILWFVAFAIISMSADNKRNAIENAQDYIGTFPTKIAAIMSMIIFPAWYAFQIQSTEGSISYALYGMPNQRTGTVIICGLILGVIIAAIARLNLISKAKSVSVFVLPFLLIYYIFSIFISSGSLFDIKTLYLSWPCVMSYVAFWFSGMVNLPTFFRHARSKYDAYLGITFLVLIMYFFEIASIWVGDEVLAGLLFKDNSTSMILVIANFSFAVLLLMCSNLINIYFAYPSWEFVIPKIKKSARFFIVGIVGSLIYLLARFFPSIHEALRMVINTADDCIANLGVALLLVFSIRVIVQHRPRPFEKMIGAVSWIVGCSAIIASSINRTAMVPLTLGIQVTLLIFGMIIFCEEPFWSFRKLRKWLQENKHD